MRCVTVGIEYPRQESVPLAPEFGCMFSQHSLESAVKAFYRSVTLWVVCSTGPSSGWCHGQTINTGQSTPILEHPWSRWEVGLDRLVKRQTEGGHKSNSNCGHHCLFIGIILHVTLHRLSSGDCDHLWLGSVWGPHQGYIHIQP